MDDWEDGPGPFVAYLLEHGYLDDGTPAYGIAKQVADQGEGALSEKQKYVLEEHVLKPHAIYRCSLCSTVMPWNEMADAVEEGDGYCGYCRYKMNKND